MKYEEIDALFAMLAKHQGFYARLLNEIDMMGPIEFDAFKEKLEAQHFADAVDVIMYIEG